MQTSAHPTKATIPARLAIAARLLKNGNAAMSREDKAAFGIDTWNTSTDTPEELNKRAADFLNTLSVEHHWTALATKSIYQNSLTDARKWAHRGVHDEFSAASIHTLHLLHAIDDIQYAAFRNEIAFLQRRYYYREIEALSATAQ